MAINWTGAYISLCESWNNGMGGPGLSTVILPLLSENEHAPKPPGSDGPTMMG